jgi:hypothetical protein
MSDRLTIRFASDMPAATVEVISPDLQVVDRVMLNAGRSREVDVPSEQSFLRVHLPSGQVVTLQDPGNLDRKISMAMIRGGGRATGTRGASIAPQVVDPPEETTFDAIRQYHRLRSGQPRISEGEGDTLPLSSQATVTLTAPGGYIQKGVSSSRGREAHWDVGGAPSQEPLRLRIQHSVSSARLDLCVPGNTREVWARSDTIRERGGQAYSVRLTTSEPASDTILGYLQRGDLYSAEAMAEWCDEAQDMLMSKMADPYAAAVGGYLLLKLKRFDRMRDWARNLATYFPFLSDGSIIWATQLIQQQPSNEAEIRQYLLQAARIGPPVYSIGMSLLTDGLRLMGADGRAALAQVLNDRDVLLSTSPLTAFIRTADGYMRGPDALPAAFDIGFTPAT